jgi:hypothetical protein
MQGVFYAMILASLGVLASSVPGMHFYPQLGIAHIGAYPIHTYAP